MMRTRLRERVLLSRDGAGRRRLDVGVEVDGEAVASILARVSCDGWKWNVCVIMLHCLFLKLRYSIFTLAKSV